MSKVESRYEKSKSQISGVVAHHRLRPRPNRGIVVRGSKRRSYEGQTGERQDVEAADG